MAPRLASQYAFEVDRATENKLIADDALVQSAWATVHQLRGPETIEAFRHGRGPLSAFVSAPAGGATGPSLGLGALATAIGAAGASSFGLPTFPNG
ncbi:MAG TPA: hypothetical protein VE780_10875 [Thermoleophilaceae bacterium]|jgi:hypothetical protein|nr:hypothetical protein [Thermoleophilaceae bacterium]